MNIKNMFKFLFVFIFFVFLISGCTNEASTNEDLKVDTDENIVADPETEVQNTVDSDFIDDDVEIGELI